MDMPSGIATGYSQITAMTAAKALGAGTLAGGIPAGTQYAVVRCEAQAVRWTDDGATTPTATVGMPMLVADQPMVFTSNLGALLFIAQVSGAILNVSFYKTTNTLLPE